VWRQTRRKFLMLCELEEVSVREGRLTFFPLKLFPILPFVDPSPLSSGMLVLISCSVHPLPFHHLDVLFTFLLSCLRNVLRNPRSDLPCRRWTPVIFLFRVRGALFDSRIPNSPILFFLKRAARSSESPGLPDFFHSQGGILFQTPPVLDSQPPPPPPPPQPPHGVAPFPCLTLETNLTYFCLRSVLLGEEE